MTTNDAKPREHVAMTILFVDRDKPDELIAANWEARKDRNSGLESQEELLRYADNAIAAHSEYLWQAADDWDDVQLKVAMMLEGEVKCDVAPDSYHAKLEEMTSEIVTTLLTALIGPRPQGDER